MTTQLPAVSVIVPAYNAEQTLRPTLEHILASRDCSFEVIVVDDGSRDRTAAIAGEFEPRVRLVRQENRGGAAARNTGIRAARASVIAFCDADDVWHPDKLRAQIAVMRRDPLAGAVYGEFAAWDPSEKPSPEFPSANVDEANLVAELGGSLYHKLLLTNWVLPSTSMFRREVFDKVGGFDEELRMGEDWDFMLRASREFRFAKLRDVVALYRHHPGQVTRRPTAVNYDELIPSRAVSRFGMRGPNGEVPDLASYRRRRFRGHFNFGLQALPTMPGLAAGGFLKALRLVPWSPRALAWLAISLCRLAMSRLTRNRSPEP